MSPFFIIFAPFLRLVGHSLAAVFGFSGIAVIAVLPVQLIRLLSTYASLGPDAVELFQMVEVGILYGDAILLVFVIAIYSIYFIVEQWRALATLLRAKSGSS
jgi:hypothetical protein